MQLITHIGHLGPMHDLPIAPGVRIDIHHRNEIGTIDPRALIQRSDIHKLLRGLLTRHRRRRVPGPVVLVIIMAVSAHAAGSFCSVPG